MFPATPHHYELKGGILPNLGKIFQEEIRRLAKKEIRSETTLLRKQSAQYRRDIAKLKRENGTIVRKLAALEKRARRRLGEDAPTAGSPPEGTRFSTRSLKAQRRKTGLSQADYGRLLEVSTLTMNNWENGKTRPSPKHIGGIVAIRGLGKREAEQRLDLLEY